MLNLAKVIIEYQVESLDISYTYYYLDDLNITPGIRVLVPFNNVVIIGLVLSIETTDLDLVEYQESVGYKIKKITSIVDDNRIITEKQLALGEKLSEYYLVSRISIYLAMLPKAIKIKSGATGSIKYKTIYKYENSLGRLTKSQLNVLEEVKHYDVFTLEDVSYSKQVLGNLVKKGNLSSSKIEDYRLRLKSIYQERDYLLNDDQKKAIDTINKTNGTTLLYGVTSSGKSEVYAEVVNHEIEKGNQAIILFPMISLSDQMISFYLKRIKGRIAIFHSNLTDSERYDQYRLVLDGKIDAVIGTRSAIFSPLTRLSVVVIDEEQSSTYKQTSTPRYSVLDVANILGVEKIILGSATPSICSFAKARKGVYNLVTLPNRVNNLFIPRPLIIDMNKEKESGNYSIISRLLEEKIKDTIKRNEKVVILSKRRGFSQITKCLNCNTTFICPNCEVNLIYHQESNTLDCHHCGYSVELYKNCPECGSSLIRHIGLGSEKIESILRSKMPVAKIVRMDKDSTNYSGGIEDALSEFKTSDILIGTEMVSRGFNFPTVTLSVVLLADTLFNLNNYKAAETAFELISQTVGRSGRFIKGEAIIQTYQPNNYIIKCLEENNYFNFYTLELAKRKRLKYPPFNNLLMILVVGLDKSLLFDVLLNIKNELIKEKDVTVLGPSLPYVSYYKGDYLVRLMVKYNTLDRKYLRSIKTKYTNKAYSLIFDFDPNSDN